MLFWILSNKEFYEVYPAYSSFMVKTDCIQGLLDDSHWVKGYFKMLKCLPLITLTICWFVLLIEFVFYRQRYLWEYRHHALLPLTDRCLVFVTDYAFAQ